MASPNDIHNIEIPIRHRMEALVRLKQREITAAIENIDQAKFHTDAWERGDKGGGGQSMVLQNGEVFEKGGVNISIVHGTLPAQAGN